MLERGGCACALNPKRLISASVWKRTQQGDEVIEEEVEDVELLLQYHDYNAGPEAAAGNRRADPTELEMLNCSALTIKISLYRQQSSRSGQRGADTPPRLSSAVAHLG